MRQNPTDFCGPLSLLMELARRKPTRFVRGAAELVQEGTLSATGGLKYEAEEDLRAWPVPAGSIAEVEWVYAATMRDDSNISDDVEEGDWLTEGITWPWEMALWTERFLGLKSGYISCIVDGELEALREGQRAIDRGGVAFLLIESDLLHDGDSDDDHEEDVWWRTRRHHPGGEIDHFGTHWTHSVDDNNILPDHYVVLRGGLEGASSGSRDFRVLLWSFGCDFEVKGAADGFGEYLYGVVTGVPDD